MNEIINKVPQNCRHFLPVEIWEIILNSLVRHPRTVISAANVCTVWRLLVTTICQKYCRNHLNDRLLKELAEVRVTHKYLRSIIENGSESIDWIKVYWLYHETFINVDTWKNIIPLQFQSVTSIASEDPYLIVTTYNKDEDNSRIIVLKSEDFSFFEDFRLEKSLESLLESLSDLFSFQVHGKVFQTCFLILVSVPRPIMMMLSSLDMRGTIFKDNNSDKKDVKILFTNPRIKGVAKISCDGCQLLTVDEQSTESLLLYKATSVDDEAIQLTLLNRIQFPVATPYEFVLSGSLIHTMEPSGHIKSYKINDLPEVKVNTLDDVEGTKGVTLSAQSVLKKDLRYPNPTLFFKDFVFSSTLISRNLLWYWHMDRGREYWIIGDLTQNTENDSNEASSDISSIDLSQIQIGHETGFTVTVVHFQRRILLCGTSEGHILGYKLKNNFENSSNNKFEDWTKVPWLLVRGVMSQPINRLGCLYTPLGLLVAAVNGRGFCSVVYLPSEDILE